MQTSLTLLDALYSQEKEMIQLLTSWVNINSWSENPEGLSRMANALEKEFQKLECVSRRIPLASRKKLDAKGTLQEIPSSHALSFKKHPEASYQILLTGHLDTVYPPSSVFQSVEQLGTTMLRGPGIVDMKGGLLILLKALETLEKSPLAGSIGWEVLINPDEEIGSPGSEALFIERAPHYNCALIFEPAFPDGSLVSERKGSINYTIIAHGKSAHAGRDYHQGRNAITAMAQLIQELEALNDRQKDITVNIGSFDAGGSPNIVPDLAICKINIRMHDRLDLEKISQKIVEIINSHSSEDNVVFELHEQSKRFPKLFNKSHRELFELLKASADQLGIDLDWQPSGGVCDGNTLSAAGLPTIDTLGAVGGHMHTHNEYILISSLVERTRLTAAFLMQLATIHGDMR